MYLNGLCHCCKVSICGKGSPVAMLPSRAVEGKVLILRYLGQMYCGVSVKLQCITSNNQRWGFHSQSGGFQ